LSGIYFALKGRVGVWYNFFEFQNGRRKFIMIKRLIISAAAFVLMPLAAKAALPIDIKINGSYLFCDSAPYISEDISFAPIRAVAEAVGADVSWDGGNLCAEVKSEGKRIRLYTDKDYITVDGNRAQSGVGLHIKEGRTMVPVRLLSELLGADVSWDNTYRNVDIKKAGVTLTPQQTDYTYSDDEVYWLSRIIDAEACGESYRGKIAVGDVIMNRIKSPQFPNTIYGVIFDRKYGVQFEPTINGAIYRTPCPDSSAAAKTVLRNKSSSVGECLYFFAPNIAESSWIANNRVYYTTIGNHVFYL